MTRPSTACCVPRASPVSSTTRRSVPRTPAAATSGRPIRSVDACWQGAIEDGTCSYNCCNDRCRDRLHVSVLLPPELTIDRAALDELAMRRYLHCAAFVHYEDAIAIHQRGKTVGDNDHCPAIGDPHQVRVYQRL